MCGIIYLSRNKGRDDMNEFIDWVCPKCGTKNTDSYIETFAPICENCDYYSDMWDDILSYEEMIEANKLFDAE